MNLPLNHDQQELIRQKVESGLYSSPNEVISTALRLLDQYDHTVEELRKDVQEGVDQLDRGEYTEYTDETLHQFFEEIEAQGLKELEAQPQKSD